MKLPLVLWPQLLERCVRCAPTPTLLTPSLYSYTISFVFVVFSLFFLFFVISDSLQTASLHILHTLLFLNVCCTRLHLILLYIMISHIFFILTFLRNQTCSCGVAFRSGSFISLEMCLELSCAYAKLTVASVMK